MSVFHDEIEIEDFDYDEEEGIYYYPCPCGDRFQVSKEELLAGEEVATCPSCSLIVKVIYDLFVMATSSSDESNMAPKDFQLSSSSDSGSRLSPNRQKCPLCQNFRHTFYCKDCIHSGFFYSSKPKAAADNCFDKQKVLLELQYTRRIAEKDCTKLLEAKRKPDVCLKIRQAKERNRILKLAVEEKKQKKALNNFKLMELREKNEEHKKNLPKYGHKVEEMEIYVAGWKDKNERTREVWKQKEDEIRNLVKLRIQQLFKYIFPIFKVMPPTESESSDDMVSALAEASQTTYIHDRWRYTDYSGEMQYGIVAPTLPHSGNYSAYTIWVAQNQDAVPSSSSTHFVGQNPAYSISAALTYTAQLVHVLSFYLNVRLPYKMNYSDFYSSDMAEQHFVRRVARLNANVLYLCFSQNVDSHWLRSCETIHNLLQLIENERSDLGRQGPIEVDLQQADVLEQPLSNDLRISDASDSEEWEAVPHDCPEVAAGGIAPIQTPQMMSTQQASSMAGGLVNSIASILRGFTGR